MYVTISAEENSKKDRAQQGASRDPTVSPRSGRPLLQPAEAH